LSQSEVCSLLSEVCSLLLVECVPRQEKYTWTHAIRIWDTAIGCNGNPHRYDIRGRIALNVLIGVSCLQFEFGTVVSIALAGPVGRKEPCFGSDTCSAEWFAATVTAGGSPVVIAEIVGYNQLAVSSTACRPLWSSENTSGSAEKSSVVPIEAIRTSSRVGWKCGLGVVPIVTSIPCLLQIFVLLRRIRAKHYARIGYISPQVFTHGPVYLGATAPVTGQSG